MDQYIEEYHNEPIKSIQIENVTDFNAFISDRSCFKIFHTNIRSISNSKNADELYVYLSTIMEKFEIIILTETFRVHDKDIFGIEGFNTLYNEGEHNRYDGIVPFAPLIVKK